MKCAKCGKDLVEGAQFCAFCGQPTAVVEPEDDRVLVRPKKGRILAGVAAGMSDAFGMPVIAIRILWVLVTVFSVGLMALVYIALRFAIPEGD